MGSRTEAGGLLGPAELADLGGVSRRTVRFYIQEGLLPAPLGVGRGRHYGPDHLKRLLQVKALQEQGRTLADIKEAGAGGSRSKAAAMPPRAQFVRLEVLPGVELNISSAYRVPSPGRLGELLEWCRAHVRRVDEEER